ncbi:MAG: Stp1/IreP family PP2C-type Ser/Thr phosphatase [Nocardiaceae bacterium]|nr:Stp1/IreP family PP2C-type Ser/Thr phosphatase [Nocardiaceae bacterium]
MTLVLRYAARSDRGLVRSNNEDSVYAGARLLALADGMGGHAAGEVASQLVIAALAPLDDDEPGDDLLTKLADATREGNESIADHVDADPELDGMGTTLTAILFAGRKLGLAHVGDSRAYLLRDGELTQITRDDTFVQSLVDEGRITPEQAHTHPQRSLIMRALTGNDVDPTLTIRETRENDRYMLCSDGLSDVVSDETIAATMRKSETVDECAERLVELALRSGGPDNVTVIVADVKDVVVAPRPSKPIVAGAVSDTDENSPTPDTAAGRAAAIRPQKTTPRRSVLVAEDEPPKKVNKLRLFLLVLAVAILAVVGVWGGLQWISTSYYVGADGNKVVIYNGVDASIFGHSMKDVDSVACVSEKGDFKLLKPGIKPTDCNILLVEDLRPSARADVRSGLPLTNHDDAVQAIRRIAVNDRLPLCKTPEQLATETTTPEPTTTTEPSPAPSPGATTTAPTPTTTRVQTPGQTCRLAK